MLNSSFSEFDSESSINSYVSKIYNLNKNEKTITTKIHKKFEILFYEDDHDDDLIMTSNLNDHFYYEEEFKENERFFQEEMKNLEKNKKIKQKMKKSSFFIN